MQGIPSSYDGYFAADSNLEAAVYRQLSRNSVERVSQECLDDGSLYYAVDRNVPVDIVNTKIENGVLTPAKRVEYRHA